MYDFKYLTEKKINSIKVIKNQNSMETFIDALSELTNLTFLDLDETSKGKIMD